MSETIFRRVEEAIREAIKSREDRWGVLNISEPSLDLLKQEIMDRLRGLGISDKPDMEIIATFDMRYYPAVKPYVRIGIKLPKSNISCVATYDTDAMTLYTTLFNTYTASAAVKRDKTSDIVVTCWRS
jgi:hypothetical protein